MGSQKFLVDPDSGGKGMAARAAAPGQALPPVVFWNSDDDAGGLRDARQPRQGLRRGPAPRRARGPRGAADPEPRRAPPGPGLVPRAAAQAARRRRRRRLPARARPAHGPARPRLARRPREAVPRAAPPLLDRPARPGLHPLAPAGARPRRGRALLRPRAARGGLTSPLPSHGRCPTSTPRKSARRSELPRLATVAATRRP